MTWLICMFFALIVGYGLAGAVGIAVLLGRPPRLR